MLNLAIARLFLITLTRINLCSMMGQFQLNGPHLGVLELEAVIFLGTTHRRGVFLVFLGHATVNFVSICGEAV